MDERSLIFLFQLTVACTVTFTHIAIIMERASVYQALSEMDINARKKVSKTDFLLLTFGFGGQNEQGARGA